MNDAKGTPSDWVMGAIKKNPEGFLLLAAGAVLLMRQSGSPKAQAVAQDATSRVAEAASEARDYAADVANRTLRSAGSMASSASDYAAQTTRKVGEQSERVIEEARSTLQDGVNRVLKDQPLMIAIAGLAAGAAVASVFPSTTMEKDALGPIAEQVSDAASRVGAQLKEATGTAGETLKKAADERGLNLEGAKKVAGEVADAFTSSMSGTGSQSGQAPKDR